MKNIFNIFFLISSIISCIKIVSTKPISTAITPLLLVIGIGLLIDGIEEVKRYRNDITTNNTKTKVYKSSKIRKIIWSEVKIGNLIKVEKDELIPSDLLVICSSNKDFSFYLQTSNVDGETSLKQREALIYTQKIFLDKGIPKDEINLKKIFTNIDCSEDNKNCFIEVEQPNKNIYAINGSITFNANEKIYFDIKNTAIRGARLKNTNFIYGIVIYTGNETKIMKNIIKYKYKTAFLDKIIDKITLIILIVRLFFVLIFMCIGIICRYAYLPNYDNKSKIIKYEYEYIFYYRHFDGKLEKKTTLENIKYFTSHFILTQNLLPTSLALLFAISKIIQSLFIEFLDKHLRKNPNEKMKCFSTELLGELGSVKYIFSDKTGTLTKNETQFRGCSIFTCLFDEMNNNIDSNIDLINLNIKFPSNPIFANHNSASSVTNFSNQFNINNLLNRLKLKNIPLDIKNIEGCPFSSQGEAIEEFILNMALNHDIVCENIKGEIKYQGTNPDEVTLVGAAKELGYCFTGKSGNILTVKRKIYSKNGINDNEEIKKYEVLLKIPFSSERQRSSIIVKELRNSQIKIYNKGSDTKIFEGINNYSRDNILEKTKEHVDNFARCGLRTLCYSFKKISDNEFKEWFVKYNEMKEYLKINSNNKENEIENLIKEIESNCFLLGATALEDQLQDNVKNDIQKFIDAGINFWMLTGDKMDTAESIGNSIKLFDSDTEVYKINGLNQKEIIERMKEIKKKIKEAQSELSTLNITEEHEKKEDIIKKMDTLMKTVQNKIEIIYEEEEEKEGLKDCIEKNYTEIGSKKKIKCNENGSCKGAIQFSESRILNSINNKVKGNKVNENKANGNKVNEINIINNEPNSIVLIDKEENEDEDEDEKKQKINPRKQSIPNMSIFKFMIDNKYYVNSDVDLENMSIVKGNVAQPNMVFSKSSIKEDDSIHNDNDVKDNKDNNKIIERYKNNHEDIIITDRNNSFCNNKNSFSKSFEVSNNKSKSKTNFYSPFYRNINGKKNDNYSIINNNRHNKYKKIYNLKEQSVLETLKLTINKDFSSKELPFLSRNYRTHRLSVNLPTSAKEFLKYFNTCLEGAKEALILQQKAFTLFKLPYLYGPTNKEKDPLSEDTQKVDWTEKLKFKNYLLHTKIKYSLIINGDSIDFCTADGEASELFWFLIEHSRSIICCRCSPIQKCNIVKFVKKNTKEITLAIGDGENDVNMIKEANVGVGIFGKEGYQAAYNSDYAFSQFKYLRILLFVNGRFALLRNTYFVNMFFLKNYIYSFQGILYQFFSLFSGNFFYDELYDTMFNTIISIIPLIAYSVLDEDIDFNNEKYRDLFPDMYKQDRDSKPFNIIKYLVITFISFILSLILFSIFNISYFKMIRNSNGDPASFYDLIFNLYISIIFIHFFMVYIDSSLFNYLIIICFILQFLADILFLIIMNVINDNKLSGILGILMKSNISFFGIVISCASICLPFYILRRAELFFGMNISNLIKTNKLDIIYKGKFYRKKIAQMIRATRAIAKFKKIQKDLMADENANNNIENNLIDRNMIKIVEHYNENVKYKKKK